MMTKKIKVAVTVLLFSSSLLISLGRAQAERLESDSYIIQFGTFNISAGEEGSASYKVTQTVGQMAVGPYGQYGSSSYFVGSGFQYIYQIGAFEFVISDVDIDLGLLIAGVHNTASHNLTISTRGANGYTIFAYELRPLRHQNGLTEIPDTTCDASDCDETGATVWSDQDIPGFGFNMSGTDIPADFVDSTYFRQFADDSGAENMQVVMESDNIAKNNQSTVTYKAGVSGSQASGYYQTGVVYVAVPGF